MKNFISKTTVLFLASGALVSLASCNNKTYYHNLEKIVPYMHKVDFDDYIERLDQPAPFPTPELPACSTIRNGNLFGRNLDYYYSDMSGFLINMKKSKKRYASISTAYNLTLFEDEVIVIENDNKHNVNKLNVTPNYTVDGVNENGVACCLNTCALEDLPGGTITGTNPGKPRLQAYCVCRYVLDHATSAMHAIELLQNRNIILSGNEPSNLHYMIADKDETYVVELFDNKLIYDKKVDDKQIMTNSYLNLTEEQIKGTYDDGYKGDMILPNFAHGVERYYHLKANYNNSNTIDGMRNTLSQIRFSNMYPPTEDGEVPKEPINPTEDYSQTQIANKDYEGWEELYLGTRLVLENHRRDLGPLLDTWITTHSVIYDLENKKIDLVIQEDYSRSFEINCSDFSIKQIDLI